MIFFLWHNIGKFVLIKTVVEWSDLQYFINQSFHPRCFTCFFFQTLLAALKNEYLDINKLLEFILKVVGEELFITRSVNQLVWGYEDKALQLAKKIAPEWFYKSFIGYFMDVSTYYFLT